MQPSVAPGGAGFIYPFTFDGHPHAVPGVDALGYQGWANTYVSPRGNGGVGGSWGRGRGRGGSRRLNGRGRGARGRGRGRGPGRG